MPTAFSGEADFTGLIDPKSVRTNVAISKVIQKCFIDVNEEGTEAAAATAGNFTIDINLLLYIYALLHSFVIKLIFLVFFVLSESP